MNIRVFIVSGLFIFCSPALSAQTVQRDPVTQQITNPGSALIQKGAKDIQLGDPELYTTRDSIGYNNINGSPFWKDNYQSAKLYRDGKFITNVPVKINLVTNEIYFLNDKTELVMDKGLADKIIFEDTNESALFICNVPNLLLGKKTITDFVQVLNPGKYQLIKYIKRKINTPESTSRLTREYAFIDIISYFISSNGKTASIKKLNRESLFPLLPSSDKYEDWIKENNINFKNENDVVRFLNYYNTQSGN